MFPPIASLNTRDKLIVSALQLISEGGPDAFSAGALIQRAGVSKGALYHYFESLEQLLLEAVSYRSEERLMSTERRYAEYPELASWLQAYFEEMITFASSPAFLNILLYFNQKGLGRDEIRVHLCRNNDAYLQRMSRVIQHFYPRTIERSRLERITALILFTVEGASAHSALQQNRERFRGAWEWLIQAVVRDLAAYEKSDS